MAGSCRRLLAFELCEILELIVRNSAPLFGQFLVAEFAREGVGLLAFGGIHLVTGDRDGAGRDTAAEAAAAISAKKADAVAFGTSFLANPDLPARIHTGAPLNAPNPATFYTPGPKGYTDYPALDGGK